MKECKKIRKAIFFAFIEGRSLGKETEEHLLKCKECKDFFTYLGNVSSASEAVKKRIDDEMDKIDWRVFERRIIDKVREQSRKPLRIFPLRNLLLPKYLIPSMAILIIIVSVLIYRLSVPRGGESFSYSQIIFDKMEKASAKNEVLKYFEDSGFLLSSLVEKENMDENSLKKSKELILKKRFINQYLEDFPNARQIASKIDFIFMEFQMDGENREIMRMIDKEKLILKIKLVRDEIKEMRAL